MMNRVDRIARWLEDEDRAGRLILTEGGYGEAAGRLVRALRAHEATVWGDPVGWPEAVAGLTEAIMVARSGARCWGSPDAGEWT